MIFAMLDFIDHVKAWILSLNTMRALERHYQQAVFVQLQGRH